MDAVDDRTTRVRRTTQAGCLALSGVLIALSFAFSLSVETSAEEVAMIADEQGRFLLSNGLLAAGALLLVPGSIAIAQLLRARGSGLLTFGAVTTGLGGTAMALGIWGYTVAGRVITDDPIPREAAVQVLDAAYDDWVIGILWLLGMGTLVGPMIVGAALLRVPVVPRWLGALLVVAPVVAFLGSDGPVGAVLAVPFAVALAVLARYAQRVPTSESAGIRVPPAGPVGPAPRTPHASETMGPGARESAL